MNKKKPKVEVKSLIFWAIFGFGVTFSIIMLYWWIVQDFVQAIPMAIFIGILTFLVVKLFSDKIGKQE
jgi:predicted PurR-regulated permease PerM